MYVWIGIDVEEQLLSVRKTAVKIDRDLQFENSCFTLPMHVSLKMSFPAPEGDFEKIVDTITAHYATVKPFFIDVKGLENEETILWIRMVNNPQIDGLHDDLNNMLHEKFGIGFHEYDWDYKFHTTLFMDENRAKINEAYARIKEVALPKRLLANTFVIGTSKTGKLGSYSILKRVKNG